MGFPRCFKHVIFMGSPGVGKGTYARLAAPILQFGHVSPGDLLRATPNPEIQTSLSRGELVPEQTVFATIELELNRLREDANLKGAILDGFPRSVSQAKNWLINRVKPDLIIEFKLPQYILVQKLLGRRICSYCGSLFNVFDFVNEEYKMPAMKPKIGGVCDTCSGTLVQRTDDTHDIITSRLKMHNESHEELVEFVKKQTDNFLEFNVKTGIAQMPELIDAIQNHLQINK